MGVFKQMSKIESLIEDEFGAGKIPYLNFMTRVSILPSSWVTILKGWGISEDNIFFATNATFNDEKYDIVCLGPPNGKQKYTDYLTHNDKGPGWYCFSWKDSEDPNYISNKIEFLYNKLQEFINFMKLYKKQCKQLEKLLEIHKDTSDTTMD